MQITITPSESPDDIPPQHRHHEIGVGCPRDDVPIEEAIELFRCALRGWGYSDAVIEAHFPDTP